MAELLLLPRLHQLGVRKLLGDTQLLATGGLADRMAAATDFISYGASGGTRASIEHLGGLRESLLKLAKEQGFPEAGGTAGRAAFDNACATWLVEHGIVTGGEALRDDIWAFVACCVSPDVCLWRFEGAHPERFRGGLRNTFQRLWLRARALDRGEDADDRWLLVRTLTEDAFVQIIERPSIGADSHIARAIAEAWIGTAHQIGKSRMEPVARLAVRKIRIANEIICFSALAPEDLNNRFSGYFSDAARVS